MKRVEITFRSATNEMEKLNKRLERVTKAYEKKLAKAEKLGVANWTNEDRNEWLKSVPSDNGWIINKEDVKKNGAWFDLHMAKNEIERVKESIAYAEKRLEKAETSLYEYHKELEEITDLKEKERLAKLAFEQEQKEWLKDGITLEGRYYGVTPNGKRFGIVGNNGFTIRSRHCFTLYINGETIFTSGEFWRAYGVIRNS